MLGFGFKVERLRVNLRLVINRFKLLEKKKSEYYYCINFIFCFLWAVSILSWVFQVSDVEFFRVVWLGYMFVFCVQLYGDIWLQRKGYDVDFIVFLCFVYMGFIFMYLGKCQLEVFREKIIL